MEIGDTVRVVDSGQIYSTNEELAETMQLPNWVFGGTTDQNTNNIFSIIAERQVHGSPIYGIDNGSISFVINAGGVKLIGSKPPAPREARQVSIEKTINYLIEDFKTVGEEYRISDQWKSHIRIKLHELRSMCKETEEETNNSLKEK